MNVETEEIFIKQLERPENISVFEEHFNHVNFSQLPLNYKYKYCWNLAKETSTLKIQRKLFWKFWKTELVISIEPKGTDMFSLLEELKEASYYLRSRLDRKIFNKLTSEM